MDLQQILNVQKQKLLLAIKSAKETRDNAPTAAESHHDQTRIQADKLVHALEEDLVKLDQLTNEAKNHQPRLYNLRNDSEEKQFLVVPEGMGGQVIDNIQTISATSPIGQKLVSAKTGDQIMIANTSWILS